MTTHGQRINQLVSGQAVVLEKIPAGGSVEARRLATGRVQLYWRHTEAKRTERVSIGAYDSSAPPKRLSATARGYSIAAAIERARELANLNRESPGGLRAQRERIRAEQKAAEAAKIAQQRYSLRNLCLDYVSWLKKQHKPSHADANNILTNHLFNAFPETASKPARDVEKREVVTVLRCLTEAGKATTARKLRSYLRAAYACATRADSDAALPSAFIGYNVDTNPVEATAAIKGKSAKNPLAAAEMKKYWNALRDEPGVIGSALRLHVVTGGQRPAQLVRLRESDVARDTIRLMDPKGKRDEPRVHLLPMTKKVREQLIALPKKGFVLSTDGGVTPMHPTSLSTWALEIATRAGIADFQLKRVRSGIETTLAEVGVTLHIRGQLQSHGIGGVQERHYDSHQYLSDKREALERLYKILESRATVSRGKQKPKVATNSALIG